MTRGYLPAELTVDGLDVKAHYSPMGQCGGDWWWHKAVGPNHHIFAIGDATGHGIPAALITGTAFAAVESLLIGAASCPDPKQILHHVNQVLSKARGGTTTMTLALASIDLQSMRVSVALGGHPGFLVLRRSEAAQPQAFRLGRRGDLLGMGQPAEFELESFDLQPGDQILAYTDGLTDEPLADGRPWRRDRFIKDLSGLAGETASATLLAVVREYEARLGAKAPEDDVTILAIGIRQQVLQAS